MEHVLRGKTVVHQIDGKGLNIGRIFSLFGFEDYLCVNMLGGPVGHIIAEKCDLLNIKTSNFWIQEESRINTAIVRDYDGRQDVQMVNEAGPTVTPEEVRRFKQFYLETVHPDDMVVISGSAADGFTPADLVEIASITSECGGKLAVDISSDWLKEIVDQKVAILKINDDELRIAFGLEADRIAVLDEFRRRYNIGLLIITFGKDGAVAVSDSVSYRVRPPRVEGNLAVGSGDSFFAGFLYQDAHNGNLKEALVCGTACGAANASKYGAALFGIDEYKRCLEKVTIQEVGNGLLLRD
jgi:1-phosphofructokinase/tagatose 6-phosphate kinase